MAYEVPVVSAVLSGTVSAMVRLWRYLLSRPHHVHPAGTSDLVRA
ncbi:hypothetical protein BN2537_17027 [Streptomyces venezuelae]|nr:hypothetical protein BN2537_17027 [Streptomyces venezuelae]